MQQNPPNEAPFEEPAGEPPPQPNPFTEPSPGEFPFPGPDREMPQCPPEFPPDPGQ